MLRTTLLDAMFPSDQRFQMGMNWRAGPILCQVNSHALSDRDGGNFLPRATTRAALLHLINDERWEVKPALAGDHDERVSLLLLLNVDPRCYIITERNRGTNSGFWAQTR